MIVRRWTRCGVGIRVTSQPIDLLRRASARGPDCCMYGMLHTGQVARPSPRPRQRPEWPRDKVPLSGPSLCYAILCHVRPCLCPSTPATHILRKAPRGVGVGVGVGVTRSRSRSQGLGRFAPCPFRTARRFHAAFTFTFRRPIHYRPSRHCSLSAVRAGCKGGGPPPLVSQGVSRAVRCTQ